MALGDDKIKDLFSSKLNGFEPEVPASVWGGIDQLLSQLPPAQAPEPTSSQATNATTVAKTGGAALKTTLIAVGVAASVATGVFLAYDSKVGDVPHIVEEVTPKEIVEEIAPMDVVEENTKVLAQADFVRSTSVAKHNRASAPANSVYGEETAEVKIASVKAIEEKAEVEEQTESLISEHQEEAEILAPSIPKFLKEDISIGVRASLGVSSSRVKESGGDMLFSRNDRSSEFMDMLKAENKEYELSHNLPISVGLTVSKQLSSSFSLETGLVFTYLSSNIKSTSDLEIKEKQTFGYLGIPIYLNYNFLELHKAKFYISLGAMMQKDVYGRYTSRLAGGQYMLGLGIPADVLYGESADLKRSISQSHWQFSSHFAIGASYPIYRKVFVYTSVGGAYYFDAGNEYRTIYSDKKFQMDVNLGLRVDF